MNTATREYVRFRAAGHKADSALRSARTKVAFDLLESAGSVRIVAAEEEESYFDVYGVPDDPRERAEHALEVYGNYCVYSQVRCEQCHQWETVDSVGHCAGYRDATSPYENAYVIDLMQSAVDYWLMGGTLIL